MALGKPVAELQQIISSREFAEWRAFDAVHPIGDLRDDYRTAMICVTLANLNRDPKEVPQPYDLEDFLLKFRPDFGEEEEFAPSQSQEDIWTNLRAWASFSQLPKQGKTKKP